MLVYRASNILVSICGIPDLRIETWATRLSCRDRYLPAEALFSSKSHAAEAAAHHLAGHSASAHLLEHFCHLRVLAQELIYVLHAGAAAGCDAFAARTGDDFVIEPFFGGHGVDDGFEAHELLFIDAR